MNQFNTPAPQNLNMLRRHSDPSYSGALSRRTQRDLLLNSHLLLAVSAVFVLLMTGLVL
jgi:hypothetical protein